MDEDTLNDLKQFITATVSQATANMATKDDIADTKSDIATLSTRIDDLDRKLSAKIDDLDLKVDTISDVLHEQLSDHETRLTKLEHQAA